MQSSTESTTASWRDLHCGAVRADHVGRRVTVSGWADTRRDHGGLVFIDLRDHTGLLQLVANPEHAAEAAAAAHEVRNEFVLRAEGEIVPRAPEAVNPNLPTGEVELRLDRLEIVSRSTPLPFQLDEENVDEVLRLRYRWLDMRRGQMQRNLRLNHVAIAAIRRTMDALGFVDVWTPSMTKGTPEGARDFLVPVRLQPGKFFALAQSPQLFKQLCMIGGLDRYYQIATCWRDEDLRADRQFEFRQLDLEMAFVEREDVLEVLEECVVAAFEAAGREPPPRPFPRMSYAEAMAKYGSDKPDLRFGLEIQDATEITRGLAVRRLRGAPRPCGSSSRRSRSRALSSRGSRSSRRSGARRASRTSSGTRAGRYARRSPSSSPSASSRRSWANQGRPRCSRPATRRPWRACSAVCARTSGASSGSPKASATRSTGSWTSRCSSATRRPGSGRSCTTRSRRRCPATRRR